MKNLLADSLIVVARMLPHMKVVGIAPLSDRRIIESAASIKCLLQALTLLACGIQSELVRDLAHRGSI